MFGPCIKCTKECQSCTSFLFLARRPQSNDFRSANISVIAEGMVSLIAISVSWVDVITRVSEMGIYFCDACTCLSHAFRTLQCHA